jgi:hypothetical protein
MQLPVGTNYGVWGFLGGAVVTMVVGFAWGGWVTGSSAESMASKRAETAVVSSYVPVCVSNAQQADPAKLAELKGISAYSRGDYVMKAGWADGAGDYSRAVARECATKTMDAMASLPKPG